MVIRQVYSFKRLLVVAMMFCVAQAVTGIAVAKPNQAQLDYKKLLKGGDKHIAIATSSGLSLSSNLPMAYGMSGRSTKAEAVKNALRQCTIVAKRHKDFRPCKIIIMH